MTIQHAPCSPYFMLSDFRSFLEMKEDFWEQHYASNEVERTSKGQLWKQCNDFFHDKFRKFVCRKEKYIWLSGDYFEKQMQVIREHILRIIFAFDLLTFQYNTNCKDGSIAFSFNPLCKDRPWSGRVFMHE